MKGPRVAGCRANGNAEDVKSERPALSKPQAPRMSEQERVGETANGRTGERGEWARREAL
jgi:hypothetical protein